MSGDRRAKASQRRGPRPTSKTQARREIAGLDDDDKQNYGRVTCTVTASRSVIRPAIQWSTQHAGVSDVLSSTVAWSNLDITEGDHDPKISVTGLARDLRNVGYKMGAIFWPGLDMGLQLRPRHPTVRRRDGRQKAGINDCFVETGTELALRWPRKADAPSPSRVSRCCRRRIRRTCRPWRPTMLASLRAVTSNMDRAPGHRGSPLPVHRPRSGRAGRLQPFGNPTIAMRLGASPAWSKCRGCASTAIDLGSVTATSSATPGHDRQGHQLHGGGVIITTAAGGTPWYNLIIRPGLKSFCPSLRSGHNNVTPAAD